MTMPAEALSPPVVELLEWISLGRRSYSETIDAWKTHCPRLSAWEDALSAKLIEVRPNGDGESLVVLTAAGASAQRGSHF
jgi:hypothetical protein